MIGLLSQAGLLLAPWAVTRGTTPRAIAALLMGPSGVFLSIFAYEGFTRYAAGAPIWAVAWAAYVCGVFVYAVAYVALARGRLGWQPGVEVGAKRLVGDDGETPLYFVFEIYL